MIKNKKALHSFKLTLFILAQQQRRRFLKEMKQFYKIRIIPGLSTSLQNHILPIPNQPSPFCRIPVCRIWLKSVHIKKVICIYSLKFSKTGLYNKIKKTYFVYAKIHHHLMQWVFPIHDDSHVKQKHLNTHMYLYSHSHGFGKHYVFFRLYFFQV